MRLIIALLLSILSCATSSPVVKHRDIRSNREQEVEVPLAMALETEDPGQCIYVKSREGTYSYTSPGSHQVCGLYIMTDPQYFVEFEFDDFDIGCTKGGLLSVIDGWELNGQFFPGDDDHLLPKHQRFHEFCGTNKPWKAFRMSQNVGLLEFRIPTRGEGFTVTVRFRENPKPCNALLQSPTGVHTLRNYGRRINCSISIIFPESFRILATNIGSQDKMISRNLYIETGLLRKCKKRGMEDFVEVRGGDGLDPGLMSVADEFCGVDSRPSPNTIDIACGNSAIRLVSSGRHENSVTISFEMLNSLADPSLLCPTFLGTL